jgi:uncharacterized membrane protein YhhN
MHLPALICVFCVVALLTAETRGWESTRILFKSSASLAFLAHALVRGAWSISPSGQWVVVALLLSLLGDLALLSRGQRLFLVGLAAFLCGHVAYCVAFALAGLSIPGFLAGSVGVAAIAAAVWRWLRPHVGRMRGPVIAYVCVISIMVATAFSHWWQQRTAGTASPLLLLVAALLFFLSDLCVARDRFIAPGLPNRWLGLPLYYAAQLLFGTAIVVAG